MTPYHYCEVCGQLAAIHETLAGVDSATSHHFCQDHAPDDWSKALRNMAGDPRDALIQLGHLYDGLTDAEKARLADGWRAMRHYRRSAAR
jgi:hypothetical protein